MPIKDPEARRAYQRVWLARRRDEFFRGKACVACGSSDDLELDHIDPEEKTSHRIWSWSEARRVAELAKCQVLCAVCHLKKTRTMYPDRQHGTLTMYVNGKCRCTSCREANAERCRVYRANH